MSRSAGAGATQPTVTGHLYPEENAPPNCELALATARALVREKLLPGLREPELVRSRDLSGNASFDILFPPQEDSLAWLVPLSAHDRPADLRERLVQAQPGYLAARSDVKQLIDRVQGRVASTWAGSDVQLEVERSGVVIGGPGLRAKRPPAVLFVQALGPDAQGRRIRLEAPFEYDLEKGLYTVLEVHRRAGPAASRLRDLKALGFIESNAHAIIQANRINIADVLAALMTQRKVEFRCGGTSGWTGWFSWRDFAVVAQIEERQGIRLDANKLIVRHAGLPETALCSYEGRPLSYLIEQSLVRPDTIIETAVQAAPTICLTLASRHLPIIIGQNGRPAVRPADDA